MSTTDVGVGSQRVGAGTRGRAHLTLARGLILLAAFISFVLSVSLWFSAGRTRTLRGHLGAHDHQPRRLPAAAGGRAVNNPPAGGEGARGAGVGGDHGRPGRPGPARRGRRRAAARARPRHRPRGRMGPRLTAIDGARGLVTGATGRRAASSPATSPPAAPAWRSAGATATASVRSRRSWARRPSRPTCAKPGRRTPSSRARPSASAASTWWSRRRGWSRSARSPSWWRSTCWRPPAWPARRSPGWPRAG